MTDPVKEAKHPEVRWNCADCLTRDCYQTRDCSSFRSDIAQRYRDPWLEKIHRVSTEVEGEFYLEKNRLEETIIFARRMGYQRLGIAFCIGFIEEAGILKDLLAKAGFEVSSVCCKICAIMKDERGLRKIDPRRKEAICNPPGQARALRDDNTELNIVLGLCVGHDSVFYRESAAPVTTLVVKDRVLGHNAVAALYSPYLRKRIARDMPRSQGANGKSGDEG